MSTQWFYDTSTGQVQELEHKGQQKDLLGPYATREEAEQALERAKARTEENDRRDREEDDW
ncbi:SPOR domain-containing protein [Kineococcus endophyticus]|uniref:SPOR domain-containing protein n=1 Tax=Kineococcus endophyticus TaxID=1181883 RepID=A0ABV3P278_9ACTN